MAKRLLSRPQRLALGARLRAAREAHCLTQKEAATKLALAGFTTLSNYEQGRRRGG